MTGPFYAPSEWAMVHIEVKSLRVRTPYIQGSSFMSKLPERFYNAVFYRQSVRTYVSEEDKVMLTF
jgi:hypothetical protein